MSPGSRFGLDGRRPRRPQWDSGWEPAAGSGDWREDEASRAAFLFCRVAAARSEAEDLATGCVQRPGRAGADGASTMTGGQGRGAPGRTVSEASDSESLLRSCSQRHEVDPASRPTPSAESACGSLPRSATPLRAHSPAPLHPAGKERDLWKKQNDGSGLQCCCQTACPTAGSSGCPPCWGPCPPAPRRKRGNAPCFPTQP